MAVRRTSTLLGLGSAKKHAAAIQLARSLHSSAIRCKKDESDLALKVSDNIMAAGVRYLKGDKEKLKENLRKRNSNVLFNFDHMVVYNVCDPLPHLLLPFPQLKVYEEFKACRLAISDLRHDRNVLTKEISKKVASLTYI